MQTAVAVHRTADLTITAGRPIYHLSNGPQQLYHILVTEQACELGRLVWLTTDLRGPYSYKDA